MRYAVRPTSVGIGPLLLVQRRGLTIEIMARIRLLRGSLPTAVQRLVARWLRWANTQAAGLLRQTAAGPFCASRETREYAFRRSCITTYCATPKFLIRAHPAGAAMGTMHLHAIREFQLR